MKKILFIVGCVLVVIFIYIIKNDKKVTYFEISDNTFIGKKAVKYLSSNNYLENKVIYKNNNNYRLIDLINDLKNNKEIIYNNNKYYINNLLVRSKYIVLNIGHTDIAYINNSDMEPLDYIDSFIIDYDEVLKAIRNISKEKIIIIFDYNIKNKYKYYLYNKLILLSSRYDLDIVYKNNLLNYIKTFTKRKK